MTLYALAGDSKIVRPPFGIQKQWKFAPANTRWISRTILRNGVADFHLAFTFSPSRRGKLSRIRARKVQSAREKTKEKAATRRNGERRGDGNGRHRDGRTKLFDVPFVSTDRSGRVEERERDREKEREKRCREWNRWGETWIERREKRRRKKVDGKEESGTFFSSDSCRRY